MDTIIYVYLRREYEDAKYLRQEFDMGMYRLVKVGVSRELWRILQEREPEEECLPEKEKKIGKLWEKLSLRRRHQMRIAERLRQQRVLEEENCRRKFVEELLADRDHSYFVTDEPVSLLEGWNFRGYFEEEWVMHLMQYATLNHFVILGKAECIPQILLRYVRGMKSLRWFLLERQFGDEEQELVEAVYDEYGLAVEVRLLEEERDYRRMGLVCKLPTVLIDFCEEEKVSSTDVAKGSIWLDMTASEVKRRRLEERNTGILYFSLKKEWKQPEKALYQLDTTSKNGYNT